MALSSGPSRMLGLAGGAIIVLASLYSVLFVDWTPHLQLPPEVVRPLKTLVVGQPFATNGRRYPGKVHANEQVNLAFQVKGQLIKFPIKKGQEVLKGELLGELDARNYENDVAAQLGSYSKAESDLEKYKELFKNDAASQKEVTDSQAIYDIAKAQLDTAQKALEDTRLLAPFDGVIADTSVNNFENVSALQEVLSLQDISQVEIAINIPETRVVQLRPDRNPDKPRSRLVATFEYLPQREFEVGIKEFSTEADPTTQTYTVTLVMPTPTDVTVLPGMTATITEYLPETEDTESGGFAVPIDAVPVDSAGQYFVWRVNSQDDLGNTQARVGRANVTVGALLGDDILVTSGLTRGDRIAAVGVHILKEGQVVRPIDPNTMPQTPPDESDNDAGETPSSPPPAETTPENISEKNATNTPASLQPKNSQVGAGSVG